jgi:hypothetical protein
MLLALALTVVAGGCTAGPAEPSPARVAPAGESPPVADSSAELPASDVLRAWDRARARAFATDDAAALRRLYVPGSAAGTADVGLLRGYRRRGLRVEGMRMQLLRLTVREATPGVLRLRVTDRLVGAVAVGHRVREPLPRDQASTRLLVLRRGQDGRWRIVSVRESSPPRDAGSASAPRS